MHCDQGRTGPQLGARFARLSPARCMPEYNGLAQNARAPPSQPLAMLGEQPAPWGAQLGLSHHDHDTLREGSGLKHASELGTTGITINRAGKPCNAVVLQHVVHVSLQQLGLLEKAVIGLQLPFLRGGSFPGRG